ncbi:MAG: ATP--guanido phosphotransferase [Clostridia bacterium]|nr:ATP--guanido phosphotransferase [Clostridia bacterium]
MAKAPEFIQTIVISTRIRLARNFASYPFPKRMDEAQAEDIVVLVREGLKEVDEFTEYNIANLTTEEAMQLQERYLISPALMKSKFGAAFVSADKSISIMANEEDHLREQYICKGFELMKAYERISGIDETLASMYDFAFDDKLGFITACPSNLGTGMRASVMMFLPGIARNGELKKLLPEIKAAGMTVRGAFGEGTSSEGYLYQVSNERTLGLSETDILNAMTKITMSLADQELIAREKMLKEDCDDLEDRCLRSYGILTNCAILSQDEFLTRMTDVRLGIAFGFLEALDLNGFDEFLNDMRPAAFRLSNGLKGKRERYCDKVRAETVRNVLPELVRVAKHNIK